MPDNFIQSKLPLNCEEKDLYFLALSHIQINNPYFKAKLFEFFKYDIKRLFMTDKNDLNAFAESYPDVSIPNGFLSDLRTINLDKINTNCKFITFDSPDYPKSLKALEDFPLLLYYKGDFSCINFERTLGIVGSRRATESARLNVRKIVSGFLNTDVVIVSGLAAGIDTAAHKSAVENNLKTIGVIGSGLDFIYPVDNTKLYNEIENGHGLILSEYPYGICPKPQNFPQRNRIVTGLSKGVVIAEARKKSGAMISARFALEQGKELMCIPGMITNPNCEGVYYLIKNGAGVVTQTEDILNVLNWEIAPQKAPAAELLGTEKEIYENILEEEISTEGLKQKLDIDINELMIKLTEMELKGVIIQKNGLYYIPGN